MSCKHRTAKTRRPARGYWTLIAAGEPFRLLFPLGALIGVAGVLMWPLYIWNVTSMYPGVFHARIMVEGFLTCFVVGFLGTALPRLLGVARMTLVETVVFAAALSAVACLHYVGKMAWADPLFFVTLAAFAASLGARSLFRRDTPPPAFVLVALGLLSALVGSGIPALAEAASIDLSQRTFLLGRLLLNQGYLLLLVMGIGAFLLPRFFGLPNRQSFPESLTLAPGWKSRAGFALLCGTAVLSSLALEAAGAARWGFALRAAAVLVYFHQEAPVHRSPFGGGTLALGLRVALFAIPAGYALIAVWPQWNTTFLHVVFITGFSLLTFIVASRVVLGHSGQTEKFKATLRPVFVMVSLLTLAMLTRVAADLTPKLRMSHYAYAAIAWIVGVVVWTLFILPGVRIADPEEN